MAHRHKVHKNVGGAATAYGNPKVISEAKSTENKKRGGKVHGAAAKHRVDKRARGGRVGADKAPFSSAHFKASGGAVGK